MPELRKAPLPPDTIYFLDCASEYAEISAACYSTLTLFGDSKTIDAIIERPREGRHWRSRLETCIELEGYAAAVREELDKPTQAAVLFLGYRSILRITHQDAEASCNWAFEDSTLGGCLLPYRKRMVIDLRTMNPPLRLLRRLESPSFIRDEVKRDPTSSLTHVRRLLHISMPTKAIGDLALSDVTAASQRVNELFDEQQRIAREYSAELTRRLADEHDPIWNGVSQADKVVVTLRKEARLKERRRALKRAVRTASRIMGAEAVAAFVNGKEVMLRGQTVDFAVRRGYGRLDAVGHGGMTVKVHSQDGARLGGLCIYFQNMPVIDQLLGMQLHLASGDEAMLLDTGNLYSVEPGAEAHPAIAGRHKPPPGAADGLDDGVPIIDFPPGRIRREKRLIERGFNRTIFNARMKEYVAKTLPIYKEAARTFVFGAHGRMRRLADTMMEVANG